MGLKQWLFGEDNASEKAERIVKNKRMPLLEKYLKVKKLYSDYFNFTLPKDAKEALYEMYYEQFMDEDGHMNAENYYKYLKIETDNHAFFYAFTMCKHISTLVEQGLDVKLLKGAQQTFALDVLKLKKDCNFDKNYDGTQFYANSELRQNVVNKINDFIEKNKKQEEQEIFGL